MNAHWSLAAAFIAGHPKDAAHLLEQADPRAGADVIARCPEREAAAAVREMEVQAAASLLACVPDERAGKILAELPLATAALVLGALTPEERERLLAAAPEEAARPLRTALRHPEGTAGALMDANVIGLPPETTAAEALGRVRRRGRQAGNYLYVVGDGRELVGVVSLGELVSASPGATLASVMRSGVARLPARASAEMIVAHPGWRDLHALPVVDAAGALVGAVRRETCERLRDSFAQRGEAAHGVGLALVEAFWTLTASALDQLGQGAVRARAEGRAGEARHGE